MKIYKLLVANPEYPKGTEARWNENDENYDLFLPNGEQIQANNGEFSDYLHKGQVENRPDFWELVGENVVNQYQSFMPAEGERFFFIKNNGWREIDSFSGYMSTYDRHVEAIMDGVFRTKKAAQMELLRRESRAQAWMPGEGENSFYVDLLSEEVRQNYRVPGIKNFNKLDYLIGNLHKSLEDANKWKDEYFEAFKCLF